MGLILHQHLDPSGEIGLWRIEESELFFLEQLLLTPEEDHQIAAMKGHRRLEWLAGRWLLHHMSGRTIRAACLKDEYGKPHLEDSSYQISISHSRKIAAVIAAPEPVGIDIQKLVSKISRIEHKFMREEEFASLIPATRLEHLHVYWGAKECLYKAYGRRQLDFREHINIDPFAYDLQSGRCTGKIVKDDFMADYELWYSRLEDYILVYGREIN